MLVKTLAGLMVAVALTGATWGGVSYFAKAGGCSHGGGSCQEATQCAFTDCCADNSPSCDPSSECCPETTTLAGKADCCATGDACCAAGGSCCFAVKAEKKPCCTEAPAKTATPTEK